MVTFDIVPEKSALVVVDMQNLFVEPQYPICAPKGLDLVPRLKKLIAACRTASIKIIYTAHIIRPDGSNAGLLYDFHPPIKELRVIDEGAEAGKLHKEFPLQPGDVLINKPRYGAFAGTDLDLVLRNLGIDTLIISGISTNVCCETTAREANGLDYKVIFLSDGTECLDYEDIGFGAFNHEEVQKMTLTTLSTCFASIQSIDDVMKAISS